MIRAIYKKGRIQPIDIVPSDWREGQELIVEEAVDVPTQEELDAWSAAVEAATAGITEEMHAEFMKALEQVEAESKELGRREMERSR